MIEPLGSGSVKYDWRKINECVEFCNALENAAVHIHTRDGQGGAGKFEAMGGGLTLILNINLP